MIKVPPAALQGALRERLLRSLERHAVNEKALLRYLFARSMAGKFSPITVPEIRRECKDAAKDEHSAYNTVGRLREALKKYFEQNPSEPTRVELEPYTHVLHFTRNWAPSEHVSKFWEPYFASFSTTML